MADLDLSPVLAALRDAELAWFGAAAIASARHADEADEMVARPVGGGLMLVCRADARSVYNRIIGLPDQVPAEPEFSAALREMDRLGPFGAAVDVGSLDLRLAAALEPLGFGPDRAVGTKLKFVRHTEPVRGQDAAGARVRVLSDPDEIAQASALCCRNLGLPAYHARGLSELGARPTHRLFGAFDGGVLVAAGWVTFAGMAAYLGPAGTDEAYRGRGLQTALMAARIDAARNAGASIVSGDVVFDDFGTRNASASNFRRLGFRVACELTLHTRRRRMAA